MSKTINEGPSDCFKVKAIWTPSVAQNKEDLEQLCENARNHKFLPRKLRQRVPCRKWNPLNDTYDKHKAISLMNEHLRKLQAYISSFEYNFAGRTHIILRKDLGMKRIVETSRKIIKQSLPIRCVEASFLAGYLTVGVSFLRRIPVHFKSSFNGHIYRHIVLLTEYKGKFGTLGLSRKTDLMYKPLEFDSLSDLIFEFKKSYEINGHQLLFSAVGLPLPHSFWDLHQIIWRQLKLNLENASETEISNQCSVFWKNLQLAEKKSSHRRKIGKLWIAQYLEKQERRNIESS